MIRSIARMKTHVAALQQITARNVCDEGASIIEKLSNAVFSEHLRCEREPCERIVKDEQPIQKRFVVILQ